MDKKNLISIAALVVLLGGAGLLAVQDRSQNKTENYGTEENNQESDLSNIEQCMPGYTFAENNGNYWQTPGYTLPDQYKNKKAVVKTNYGEFTIEFFEEDAPLAVENFIRLGQEGKYANAPFHRIIKEFMIQTGDYTNGDGTGGQSIWGQPFLDELDKSKPNTAQGYKRGTVAMANAGKNTNGSQFFINTVDNALPLCYTLFGKVSQGMDVVDKIASVPVLENVYGEASVPRVKVNIEQVTIQDK